MSAAALADAVRKSVGGFALDGRGVVRVSGGDRLRWTNGMLSNEVATLVPGPARSGCHALLLTPQGRIVADVHVIAREDELLLELDRAALAAAQARLERSVIADDVALADASARWRRFAIEGPHAPALLAEIAGAAPEIAPDSALELDVDGARWLVGAWGVSGEPAFQLFVPPDAAGALPARLRAAATAAGVELVDGDAAALEVLRIEAGTPAFGRELDEEVLPAEAGLVGRAVHLDKGCYTGQEIVARMHSRGAASHRLVGLRLDAAADAPLPPEGTALAVGGVNAGELTSVCRSARAGAIALGYLRAAHAAPGVEATAGDVPARVVALPFVAASG